MDSEDEEDVIYLDDLYKLLNAQYDYFSVKFSHSDELTNDEFIEDSLVINILSNSINLVVNDCYNNFYSLGKDYLCKSIMEGLLLYSIYLEGGFTDDMKTLYRYQYCVGNLNDPHLLEKYLSDPHNSEPYVFPHTKEFIEAATRYFNCSVDDLVKSKKLSEPYFYLSNSLTKKVDMKSLFDEYRIYSEYDSMMYSFFSNNLHPHYETDKETKRNLTKFRNSFLSYVFDMIYDFSHDILKNIKFDDYSGVYKLFAGSDYRNYTKKIEDLCGKINRLFPSGDKSYARYYFVIIGPLLVSMMYSHYLGRDESCLEMFHTFLEFTALLDAFINMPSKEERDYKESGFLNVSRLAFDKCIESAVSAPYFSTVDEELGKAFNDFYKESYALNSYEKFRASLRRNKMYTIDKKFNSYRDLVVSVYESKLSENSFKTIMNLYDLSASLECQTGNSYKLPDDIKSLINDSMGYATALFHRYVTYFTNRLKKERHLKFDTEEMNDLFNKLGALFNEQRIEFEEMRDENDSSKFIEA